MDEVAERFGRFQRTDRRGRLTERLRRYVEEVRGSGIATAVVIDGSYISGRDEPSDVDLILVLRPDYLPASDPRPFTYNLRSKRMVKKLYRFDILPAADGSAAYRTYVDFFCGVRPRRPRALHPPDSQGNRKDCTVIKTREGLEQTRRALICMEEAMRHHKRDYDAQRLSPAWFAFMAEGPVDYIRDLRREIEDYVGLTAAPAQGSETSMLRGDGSAGPALALRAVRPTVKSD
jgi:hypothetical protein